VLEAATVENSGGWGRQQETDSGMFEDGWDSFSGLFHVEPSEARRSVSFFEPAPKSSVPRGTFFEPTPSYAVRLPIAISRSLLDATLTAPLQTKACPAAACRLARSGLVVIRTSHPAGETSSDAAETASRM